MRILDAIKDVGPSDTRPDPLGSVAISAGVCPRAAAKPNLQESDVCLDLFLLALDFAACSHCSRPPRRTSAGEGKRRDGFGGRFLKGCATQCGSARR